MGNVHEACSKEETNARSSWRASLPQLHLREENRCGLLLVCLKSHGHLLFGNNRHVAMGCTTVMEDSSFMELTDELQMVKKGGSCRSISITLTNETLMHTSDKDL